jgi:glycolate oxidase FAD binding subunit
VADVQALGGNAVRMDNAQAGPDWTACRDQTLPFFNAPAPDLCLWRLSVPQTAAALTLPFAQFIEWHGAQRWLWAPWAAHTQLRQAAAEVGGSATLFRASPSAQAGATGRFSPLPPALAQIHQRLKNEFDPAGIFNPGRMYPAW